MAQGPAKKWEEVLLNLGVGDSEPGIDGEEIAPLAKENIATPWKTQVQPAVDQFCELT